jgi:hypothetical protein
VPWTIVPATQFHDFAAMVTGWTERDGVATIAPLLVQPIAPADIADVLAEVATGEPQGRYPDVAGPETQDLVDMARRINEVRGRQVRLVPTWSGLFGTSMGRRRAAARRAGAHHAHLVRRVAGGRRGALSGSGRPGDGRSAVRDQRLEYCFPVRAWLPPASACPGGSLAARHRRGSTSTNSNPSRSPAGSRWPWTSASKPSPQEPCSALRREPEPPIQLPAAPSTATGESSASP